MSPGQIITFYSYKGGVGRTMALANVATLLAQQGRRVLAIDFDLEGPGLHRYLLHSERNDEPAARFTPRVMQAGVIDFVTELSERLAEAFPGNAAAELAEPPAQEVVGTWIDQILNTSSYVYEVSLRNPELPGTRVPVSFMPAGRFDEGYSRRVQAFDWQAFYGDYAEVFDILAAKLRERFDYILVDSRTGLTDIGSICTAVLPDRLVLVCAPNRQAIDGAVEVGRQVVAQKPALVLIPLLCRLENAEKELQTAWIRAAQREFERVFRSAYGPDRCNLDGYFAEVRIPHISFYTYGERIAAEHERADVSQSMAEAFRKLLPYVAGKLPWEARPQALGATAGAVRTLLVYSLPDEQRARELARAIAPLGIRAVLVHDPLDESLRRELQSPACRSVVVIAPSQSAEADAWLRELATALSRVPSYTAIVPIVESGTGSASHSALRSYLRASGVQQRVLQQGIDARAPEGAEQIAGAVLQAADILDKEALVLHLGHRRSQGEIDVPAEWQHLPALDLRLELRGERDFSPSEVEWQEIHTKMTSLHRLLSKPRRLHICGLAPLGVGAMVGKLWDRGTGVELITYNSRVGVSGGQMWSSILDMNDEARTGRWQPDTGHLIRMHAPPTISPSMNTLLLALFPQERSEYIENVHRWNSRRSNQPPVLWLHTPLTIATPAQAHDVLVELLGAFRFIRRAYPSIITIELVAALPLAMMPLMGHHLRQLGPLHFYDQVLSSKEYRRAVTFH